MKNQHIARSLSLVFLSIVATNHLIAINIAETLPFLGALKEIAKTVSGNNEMLTMFTSKEAQDALQKIKNTNIDEEINSEIEANIRAGMKNINEDMRDIKIAAALTSILETIDRVFKGMKMGQIHQLMKEIKYSARTNSIHKLIMGLQPGKFAGQAHYTNSYAESIGYTANNWILNKFTNFLIQINLAHSFAQKIGTDKLPEKAKTWAKRILVGTLTHFIWGLEKYLWSQARG